LARSYNVRIAALTVGETTKWVDNVLSHNSVVGVEQGRQGVGRRLSDDSLLSLTICKILARQLGVPLATAVEIANQIVATREARRDHVVAPGISIEFSLPEIERAMRARLADAVESVVTVRRGRPPLNPPDLG
jgi:hypothetical protein